jgi:hypothetical protein
MVNVPLEVQTILFAFAPLFSTPVWQNACTLFIGAILSIGKRTVTSALKVMGLKDEERFTNYHRVLNRAKWNALNAAKILLGLIVSVIPATWPLIVLVDETIERRKGHKIKAKGCYRDAVRSSHKKVVHCFGLKWIAMMAVVPLPWSQRPWALPFLTVLAPPKSYNKAQNKRHKTTVDWTCQMIMQVRCWLPNRSIVLVGDGAYAAVKLVLCCIGFPTPVCLVSRLRQDAALYDFPPPDQTGKRGPKPKKGDKQPSLLERINEPSTIWNPLTIVWYDGIKRKLEIFSGISLWYTPGQDPVPIKWVVVRDPKGELRTESFFATDLKATEKQILTWVILRWNIEVTFEELRTHLGFETQRQWSDLAIARTTPALFSMFSVVVLIALELLKSKTLTIQTCAWYQKTDATFSDVIASVRRHIWHFRNYTNSSPEPDSSYLKDDLLETLLDIVCYAA